MISSTSKNETSKIRFDEEFKKTIDELDEKFWQTTHYEKNLYSISRCGKTEEE